MCLHIGGNLVIGKQAWEQTENIFINMGFDRVYPPGPYRWAIRI